MHGDLVRAFFVGGSLQVGLLLLGFIMLAVFVHRVVRLHRDPLPGPHLDPASAADLQPLIRQLERAIRARGRAADERPTGAGVPLVERLEGLDPANGRHRPS